MKILKNGSLRFWGDWLGRPYDDFLSVVAVDYDKNEGILVIYFDNEVKCTVYDPIDIVNNKNTFHVSKATKIVLEWYRYGEEHISQNLRQKIYSQTDNNMILKKCSYESVYDPSSITKTFDSNNHYALEIC